jgi:hypothetical protein
VVDAFVSDEVEQADLLDLRGAFEERLSDDVYRLQEELSLQAHVFRDEFGSPGEIEHGYLNDDSIPF